MAEEFILGALVENIKGNISMIENMGLAATHGQMVENISVNGKIIKDMDKQS